MSGEGEVLVVAFAPGDRCAECGGRAMRQNPSDPSIKGCSSCFPHWTEVRPL